MHAAFREFRPPPESAEDSFAKHGLASHFRGRTLVPCITLIAALVSTLALLGSCLNFKGSSHICRTSGCGALGFWGFGVLGMSTCELLQFHRWYWLVISAKRPVESELSISRTS